MRINKIQRGWFWRRSFTGFRKAPVYCNSWDALRIGENQSTSIVWAPYHDLVLTPWDFLECVWQWILLRALALSTLSSHVCNSHVTKRWQTRTCYKPPQQTLSLASLGTLSGSEFLAGSSIKYILLPSMLCCAPRGRNPSAESSVHP